MKFENYTKSNETETAPIVYEKQVAEPVIDAKPFAEPEPQNMSLNILQNNLGNCLSIIDDEVMKGYVTRLDQLPIIIQDDEVYENLSDIHFFKISELVYQEDEFSVDKLSMVFHALSNKPCTLVLMLRSNGEKTEFYLGARPNDERSAGTLFQMLKQSLLGFFPGSQISDYYDEDMKKDLHSVDVGCISSVTSVADYKQDQEGMTNKEFIQGLEKFVYAMQCKTYTSIFIADNLSYEELMLKKREYEQIYTQLSPFANMQMNFSVSDSTSDSTGSSEGKTENLSYTKTQGYSQTITDTATHTDGSSKTYGETETDTHTDNQSTSDGKTHTVGTADGTSHTETDTDSTSTSKTKSKNHGWKIGPFNCGKSKSKTTTTTHCHSVSDGTSHTDSVSDSISKTLTHGFSDSKGISKSKTYGTNESDSREIGRASCRERV